MDSNLKQIPGCLGTEVGGKERGREGRITEWQKKLGNDGHVHFLDYGDGFMSINICQNLSCCTL